MYVFYCKENLDQIQKGLASTQEPWNNMTTRIYDIQRHQKSVGQDSLFMPLHWGYSQWTHSGIQDIQLTSDFDGSFQVAMTLSEPV